MKSMKTRQRTYPGLFFVDLRLFVFQFFPRSAANTIVIKKVYAFWYKKRVGIAPTLGNSIFYSRCLFHIHFL